MEKRKVIEYKKKLLIHFRRFLFWFILLAGLTVAFVVTEYDIYEEIGVMGYNISILSMLRFLWIILFTLFLSQAVPIGLLTIINNFIIRLKDLETKEETRPAGTEGPEDNAPSPDSMSREGREPTEKEEGKLEEEPESPERSDEPEDKAESTGKDRSAEDTEALIFSFFRYTIIIIGFAYAILSLGIALDTSVDVLGLDITAANLLNALLVALITVVFIVYFLPPVLNIIIDTSIGSYARRHESEEERVILLKEEIEKIKPGLRKAIVYLIVLFAALAALSYIDCEDSPDEDDSSSQYDHYSYEGSSSSSNESDSELCQYIETIEVLIRSLIILVMALLLTMLTPALIYTLSASEGDIKKSNVYKAGKYVNYLIFIIALFLIINVLGLDLDTSVSLGESRITLWSIISAILVLVVTQMMGKMIIAMLRDTVLSPKQIDEHASIVMAKMIYITILAIGIAVSLGILGINLFAVATGLGLLGFALAFGMQDTIANFMAGIMIAIERPFRIGDRIRVGNDWGDVIDIGMRSTKIRTTKNETVVIPNNLVATREVWNFTKDSPIIDNVIPIGISYDSDWELAKKIILNVANRHPQVIKSPAAHVKMVDFGESSVDMELWAWIDDARQREIVRSDLLMAIKKRFDKEG
ncbi:MAG: mechanosensitive ion channel, partial [Thermoplasmata archaeon]|nr:mechanosensitive ion channel [Thermoplasmata archaeon]